MDPEKTPDITKLHSWEDVSEHVELLAMQYAILGELTHFLNDVPNSATGKQLHKSNSKDQNIIWWRENKWPHAEAGCTAALDVREDQDMPGRFEVVYHLYEPKGSEAQAEIRRDEFLVSFDDRMEHPAIQHHGTAMLGQPPRPKFGARLAWYELHFLLGKP